MGLYWSFLQVLDHHVGNSGQVTHVASPGAAVGPEVERGKSVTRKSSYNINQDAHLTILWFTHD